MIDRGRKPVFSCSNTNLVSRIDRVVSEIIVESNGHYNDLGLAFADTIEFQGIKAVEQPHYLALKFIHYV